MNNRTRLSSFTESAMAACLDVQQDRTECVWINGWWQVRGAKLFSKFLARGPTYTSEIGEFVIGLISREYVNGTCSV